MGRLVWFSVPNETKTGLEDPEEKAADAARGLLEKKTVLNLLEAFAVALKHALRGESGWHYEDLVSVLPKTICKSTALMLRSVPPCAVPAKGTQHLPALLCV